MVKQASLLLLASFTAGGCSRLTPSAQTRHQAAQALVDSITGNARGSRDKARALRTQADALLAAKDYTGAMDKRLQILAVRPKTFSTLGALTFYATQPLALGELTPIASHLDAPSCLKYAKQLTDIDAQLPTYSSMLQSQKASALKDLTLYSRDPQEWKRIIAGVGFTPQEQQVLANTSIAQIEANIVAIYDAEAKSSTLPYSAKTAPVPASIDPYTKMLARPSQLGRYLWTKAKTERVLVIAALLNRNQRLENRTLTRTSLNDPFGTGPLKTKNGFTYSVGPDTKDDGGKSVPMPNRIQITDTGDILAPTF